MRHSWTAWPVFAWRLRKCRHTAPPRLSILDVHVVCIASAYQHMPPPPICTLATLSNNIPRASRGPPAPYVAAEEQHCILYRPRTGTRALQSSLVSPKSVIVCTRFTLWGSTAKLYLMACARPAIYSSARSRDPASGSRVSGPCASMPARSVTKLHPPLNVAFKQSLALARKRHDGKPRRVTAGTERKGSPREASGGIRRRASSVAGAEKRVRTQSQSCLSEALKRESLVF